PPATSNLAPPRRLSPTLGCGSCPTPPSATPNRRRGGPTSIARQSATRHTASAHTGDPAAFRVSLPLTRATTPFVSSSELQLELHSAYHVDVAPPLCLFEQRIGDPNFLKLKGVFDPHDPGLFGPHAVERLEAQRDRGALCRHDDRQLGYREDGRGN